MTISIKKNLIAICLFLDLDTDLISLQTDLGMRRFMLREYNFLMGKGVKRGGEKKETLGKGERVGVPWVNQHLHWYHGKNVKIHLMYF
jgi:hypothetical protein